MTWRSRPTVPSGPLFLTTSASSEHKRQANEKVLKAEKEKKNKKARVSEKKTRATKQR
jgi:hypothetical protein